MRKSNLVLSLLLLCIPMLSQAKFSISFTTPYAVLKDNVPAVALKKKELLSGFQRTAHYYMAGNETTGATTYSCKSLVGGACVVTLDIDNTEEDMIDISLPSLPASWTVKVRRQAMISDWYSANMKLDYISFIGDALPMLKADASKRTWSLPALKSEKIRVIFDFTPKNAGLHKIELQVKSRKSGTVQKAVVNINVLNSKAPAEGFNSIIFNADNTQSGDPMVRMWEDIGLTHLQVNYIPEVSFDTRGNIVTKINQSSGQSSGFRNTALPWIRQGKTILLFWEARYEKMAPLSNGGFLKPYTPEWMTAYKNIVNATFDYLKSQYPALQKSQIVLYIADEVSSKKMTESPSPEVKHISSFLQFIKTSLPDYKTLVTFGYYSYPGDIDLIKDRTDILCPHFIMPESLANKTVPPAYNPQKVFTDKFALNKISAQQTIWGYQVEKGKNSDIRQFRLLPLIAAAREYRGLSWYAFCHSSGSSWIGNDGKILDYGLYYRKEPNNPIYVYWTGKIDNSEIAIPSMRILAAKAGLEDARLLRYLLDNRGKLNATAKSDFMDLMTGLKQMNTLKYPSLEEIEILSEQIKEIYNSIK